MTSPVANMVVAICIRSLGYYRRPHSISSHDQLNFNRPEYNIRLGLVLSACSMYKKLPDRFDPIEAEHDPETRVLESKGTFRHGSTRQTPLI